MLSKKCQKLSEISNIHASKIVNMMLKLKIDPNLVVFAFCSKSLCRLYELWKLFLWFQVMAAIQDGWHYVEVEDWLKLSSAQFSIQDSH